MPTLHELYKWSVGILGRDGFWDSEIWEVLLVISMDREREFENYKTQMSVARIISYWSGAEKLKNVPRSYEDFMPFEWERKKLPMLSEEEIRSTAEKFDKLMKQRHSNGKS